MAIDAMLVNAAGTYVVGQSIAGLTAGAGDLVPEGSPRAFFAWTAVGATAPGGWFGFNASGLLTFVEIVQSGYVTFPVESSSTVIITEQGGRVVLSTDGKYTYTPPPGYVGGDSFKYDITDSNYAVQTASVNLEVTHTAGANIRPIADDEIYYVEPGTKFTSIDSVLDGDVDGDDAIATDDLLSIVGTTFLTANGGVVSLSSNGMFTYTPKAGFVGIDSFEYKVRDSYIYTGYDASIRATDVGLVQLYVGVDLPQPEPELPVVPVVEPPEEPTALAPPSDPVEEALPPEPPAELTPEEPVTETQPVEPAAFVPPHVNQGPVAGDDEASTHHGQMISGQVYNLLDNDVDADGDTLQVQSQALSTQNGGQVTIREDGTFDYVPAAGFVGSDTFVYVVFDGEGGEATGTVTVHVTNSGPEAGGDSAVIAFGSTASGNLLQNDSDADGDVLAIDVGTFTTARGGSVVIETEGTFTYTPPAGYYGSDNFQYTISDGARSAIGVLQITIEAPDYLINGTSGAETLTGTDTYNLIHADDGDDLVYAAGGDDTVHGGDGRDTLYGDAGNDRLIGGSGKDTILGGVGADYIDGGLHGDRLTGGSGADKFVLGTSTTTDYDRINDFNAIDQLVVIGADYGLDVGALPDSSYFGRQGTADVAGHGRFVYNSSSKSLFWDSGEAGMFDQLLVTFGNKVSLTASDFEVV